MLTFHRFTLPLGCTAPRRAQIAVDGQQATESAIVEQVRGTDVVGSKVVLTVRKGGVGQVFDVALVRGAWGAVERKEKLFILFEDLMKLIKMDASKEQLEVSALALLRDMPCISVEEKNMSLGYSVHVRGSQPFFEDSQLNVSGGSGQVARGNQRG